MDRVSGLVGILDVFLEPHPWPHWGPLLYNPAHAGGPLHHLLGRSAASGAVTPGRSPALHQVPAPGALKCLEGTGRIGIPADHLRAGPGHAAGEQIAQGIERMREDAWSVS